MAEKIPQVGKFDDQFLRETKLGQGYRSYKRVLALAAGATQNFVFQTGNCDTVVYGFFIKPFAEPLGVKLYADPDIANDGTELFTINLATGYDGIEKPALNKVLTEMTVNDNGTLIDEDSIAASAGVGPARTRTGLNISSDYARIIPPNTKFMLSITNDGGQVSDFYFRIFWSENRI